MINPQRLQAETFVESIEWLKEVSSTNTHALKTIERHTDFPVLVGADLQTGGRGRGQNRWWGAEGSLTFSLILKPAQFHIPQDAWPLMSLIVGLTIGDGLRSTCPEAIIQLKWPNDVYADQKKICGILIESIPARPELVIIGIGVNVNNSLADAPGDVRNRATSVIDLVGQPVSLELLLINILNAMETGFERFHDEQEKLLNQWREQCFLTGKQICIDNSQSTVFGMCQGIDDDGALRMITVNGPQRFLAGTITLIEE